MEKLRGMISHVPSFRVVDMPTDSSSPFNVDKEKLTQLAKNKNQDILRELGGVGGIILSLKTHAGYGIRGDAADLRKRINYFESNSYRIKGIVYRYLFAMLRCFKDFSFLFPCACSVYLIIVGIILYGWEYGWQDGTYSFVLSFIFPVISSVIGQGVGDFFDKAIKRSRLVIVSRNGLKHQIPVSGILVGDIALLKEGDKIPADGLLLEAYGDRSLKLDESLDGQIVEMNYSEPFLSTGTKVVEGQAKMMVTNCVAGTNYNGIYDITEFKAQIDYLIRLLEIMKWVLAMSSFPISVSRYVSGKAKDDEGNILFIRGTTSALEVSYMIVEYIVAASVIFVAMDTANFSWALKVCFAHAINVMAACNVIVRNLSSWEKLGLGAATINVTDEFNASNQLITSTFLFVPQITENKKASSHISPIVLQLIHQGIGLNMTGISNHAQQKCKLKFLGSPSERAFLSQAALESNMDWEKLMNDCAIVKVENLENQGRVILVKKDDSFLEHRRGPAEMILAICSGYYDDVGILHPLIEDTRSLLEQKLRSMNSDSRTQVIALAYRQVPNQELKDDFCNLMGFVVLKEVNQDEIVQDVVQKCRNSGMDFNIFHERSLGSGVAGAAVTELGEAEMNQVSDDIISTQGALAEELDIIQSEEESNENKEDTECSKEVVLVSRADDSIVSKQNHDATDLVTVENEVAAITERILGSRVAGAAVAELGEMNQVSDDVIWTQGALAGELDILQSEEESNESKEDTECSKEVVSVSRADDSIVLKQTHDASDLATVENEVTALTERNLGSGVAGAAVTELGKAEMNQVSDDVISTQGALAGELDILQFEEESNESKEDTICSKEVVSISGADDSIVLKQIHDATDLATVENEVTAITETTVSISMGIKGDETMRTSDIMILDGKITSLSLILMWAKCMLLNIQTFTQFQLTVIITSIANAFISLALPIKTSGVNKELAYQAVQQTWVNTGMGLIAAITFGRQRPQPLITPLQKPPVEEKIWLITGYMLRNIMTQSAYQITVVSVLQFQGTIFGFTDRAADTTTFVVSIFLQVLNMISARKIEEKNIFSSIQPRFIWLIGALMIAPFVLVEILVRIGYFESLDEKQWAICITIALVSWPVGFAAKFVPVGFFAVPVRLVAALIMAVIYRLKELGNWIKSTASKLAFW